MSYCPTLYKKNLVPRSSLFLISILSSKTFVKLSMNLLPIDSYFTDYFLTLFFLSEVMISFEILDLTSKLSSSILKLSAFLYHTLHTNITFKVQLLSIYKQFSSCDKREADAIQEIFNKHRSADIPLQSPK